MKFEICLITDKGLIRNNNEDGFFINDMGCAKTDECLIHTKKDAPLFTFVADGVGGSQMGELATELCIQTALNSPIPTDDTELVGLIEKMNIAVCTARNQNDTACTIAGMLLGEDSIHWFNIGDSRVYSVKNGYLNQLSTDDTISGISGEYSDKKEPLVQYLGKSSLMPHIEEIEPAPFFIICTDGLTDMVSLDRMEEIIKEKQDSVRILGISLLNEAKSKGGLDNISLIIIKPLKED